MLNKLDVWLSIIDITICLIDFVFMYLIFIRMPHNKTEDKPRNNFKKFPRRKNNG
jgi:hypothetical protein